jgi:hypothetical protein
MSFRFAGYGGQADAVAADLFLNHGRHAREDGRRIVAGLNGPAELSQESGTRQRI